MPQLLRSGPLVVAVVGPDGNRQVGPRPRPRRGARRRDRQRRRLAALPRHGHRHGQAPGGGAPRHPAPPARRPRGHRGSQRRGIPAPAPGPTSPRSPGAGGTPCWSAAPASTSGRCSTGSRSRPPTRESGGGWRRRPLASAPRRCCSGCATLDPAAASAIEANNARRIVRALEVIELTGRPFSATMPSREYVRPTVTIGLELPRRRPRRADRRARAPDVVARACLTRSGPWSRWACATAAPPRGPSATPRRWPQIDGDLTEDEALAQTRDPDPQARAPPGVVVPARPADHLARPRRARHPGAGRRGGPAGDRGQ